MTSRPCGLCINCKIDKRNEIVDKVRWEWLNKYDGVGAFVTLTFDDVHLLDKKLLGSNRTEPDVNGREYITCRKKQISNFIEGLRQGIKKRKLADGKLINENFKWLGVTEYGGEYGRPHMHFILLGIDWYAGRKLIEHYWSGGICDVGPIENGGIEYVVKYLDKQMSKEDNFNAYERWGIEAPTIKMSRGMGRGMYEEAAWNGKDRYIGKHNIEKPIPTYWKNKLIDWKTQTEVKSRSTTEKVRIWNEAHDSKNQMYVDKNGQAKYTDGRGGLTAETALLNYGLRKALEKEERLTAEARAHGEAVADIRRIKDNERVDYRSERRDTTGIHTSIHSKI